MTQGLLKIEENTLIFKPNTYPTSQIRAYGFRWNAEHKYWESSPSIDAIEGTLRLFYEVEIDSTVTKWRKEYEAPIEIPEFIMNSPAKDFQKEPAAVLVKRKRAMLGLAPGLGKSFCATIAAESMGDSVKRILVVCPLSLVRNWKNEIYKWSGKTAAVWHGAKIETATRWVITNYDSVVRDTQFYIQQNFDIIIIDESVLVKNRKAKRSQCVKAISKNAKYVWLLSGSPTTKFYDDMWMQLNILDPKRFSSYWKFAEKYCILERNQWGTAIINNAPNSDMLIKKDLSDIYYARTQDQVINLPPWLFDTIEVPMSDSQYKLYDQMEKEFIATLPSGDNVLAPIVLTQMLRLIQFASNPVLVGGNNESTKWDAVEEMLEYEELPAIIWTTFKATANLLSEKLKKKYKVAPLTGDTKEEERQKIVDSFQSGGLDVIIAHPGVGKFGFTLTAARTAIYLERGYSGDDYYQSLHRVRRIGTTKSPHVIHLIASRPNGHKGKTIDHVIDKVLEFRKNSTLALTSGEVRKLFDL